MARIIYGSIITDIAGSIGGITFQKNGAGTIARLKPRKTKTNTQKQRDQQPRLKEVQRNWNELSLTNKILWNDFSSINNKIGLDGNEKVLTGYQWFLTINQNRLLFEDSILSIPPAYEIVNPINYITLLFSNDELTFEWDTSIGGTTYRMVVNTSFVLNSASKFDFNKCRNIVRYVNPSAGTKALNVSPDNLHWQDYFNSVFPPNLGNKSFYFMMYVRFISELSGISSLAYTLISKFVWTGLEYEIE